MDTNAAPSSHSWTIKTKDNAAITHYEPPLRPAASSSMNDPFEDRIKAFAADPSTFAMVNDLRVHSETELQRRHTERQARKSISNGAPHPTVTSHKQPLAQQQQQQQQQEQLVPQEQAANVSPEDSQRKDHAAYQFLDVGTLTGVDQKAWHTNIRKDTGINYPHRWLRLASLFSVQSKTLRQPSFLTVACETAALQDLDGQPQVMENYLKIRDTQNRNYATEAVQEGIKEFGKKNVAEAMDCYKRALDMDQKYAEGWFRMAEALLHENKRREAVEPLERALRCDPQHERAKAMMSALVSRSAAQTEIHRSSSRSSKPRSRSTHGHSEPQEHDRQDDRASSKRRQRHDRRHDDGDMSDEDRGRAKARQRRRRRDDDDKDERDREDRTERRRRQRRHDSDEEEDTRRRSSRYRHRRDRSEESHRRRRRRDRSEDRHRSSRHSSRHQRDSRKRSRHHSPHSPKHHGGKSTTSPSPPPQPPRHRHGSASRKSP